MLRKRVIPLLLLHNGGLYKTTKFKCPVYVGDPINVTQIFNKKEVDELIVLDIDATRNNTPPNLDLIDKIASQCFMPLTYGGGINNLTIARDIMSLGVEKLSLQSSLTNNPRLISDLVNIYGTQCIVGSIDLHSKDGISYQVYDYKTGSCLKIRYMDFIQNLINLGVGEILINFVNLDGTKKGIDLDVINKISSSFSIPFIFCGGISDYKNIINSFDSGANAIAAGSLFYFYGKHKAVLIDYPSELEVTRC